MIWKKTKITTIDCFTWDPGVYNHSPIQYLSKARPEWFKQLDSSPDLLNMKTCPGFITLFNNGFYLPAWTDMRMQISTENFIANVSDPSSISIESHNPEQWGNFIDNKKHHHIKIDSPWFIESNKETKFLLFSAVWNGIGLNEYLNFSILPGITDFYFQHGLNINAFLYKTKKPTVYNFEFKQPLMYCIPLSEHKIKIKNHLISHEEWKYKLKKTSFSKMFKNRYYRHKKSLLK